MCTNQVHFETEKPKCLIQDLSLHKILNISEIILVSLVHQRFSSTGCAESVEITMEINVTMLLMLPGIRLIATTTGNARIRPLVTLGRFLISEAHKGKHLCSKILRTQKCG